MISLHRLANFNQLRGPGRRVGFSLRAPPSVCLVVMIDIAEQQAAVGLVDDQPDVAVDADGPEPLVPRLVELVESHPGIGRIDLQIERGGLHGFLLVAGEASEAVGEGVGDAEIH